MNHTQLATLDEMGVDLYVLTSRERTPQTNAQPAPKHVCCVHPKEYETPALKALMQNILKALKWNKEDVLIVHSTQKAEAHIEQGAHFWVFGKSAKATSDKLHELATLTKIHSDSSVKRAVWQQLKPHQS